MFAQNRPDVVVVRDLAAASAAGSSDTARSVQDIPSVKVEAINKEYRMIITTSRKAVHRVRVSPEVTGPRGEHQRFPAGPSGRPLQVSD